MLKKIAKTVNSGKSAVKSAVQGAKSAVAAKAAQQQKVSERGRAMMEAKRGAKGFGSFAKSLPPSPQRPSTPPSPQRPPPAAMARVAKALSKPRPGPVQQLRRNAPKPPIMKFDPEAGSDVGSGGGDPGVAFKKGGMVNKDKVGRAMKKSTADAKGRAMKTAKRGK